MYSLSLWITPITHLNGSGGSVTLENDKIWSSATPHEPVFRSGRSDRSGRSSQLGCIAAEPPDSAKDDMTHFIQYSILKKHRKYTVLDLHHFFLNDLDVLDPTFSSDGVHLNQNGYQILTDKICHLIARLNSNKK